MRRHIVPPVSEPGEWEGDVVLADGATLHVRAMQATTSRCSPECTSA